MVKRMGNYSSEENTERKARRRIHEKKEKGERKNS